MIPLVISAIENDEDRWFMQQLYEQYKRLMISIIYIHLRDKQYVEDVVGEVCVALIDKLQTLQSLPVQAQQAYVVLTAKNRAINYSKKLAHQQAHNIGNPDIIMETSTSTDNRPDTYILFREQIAAAKRAISRLPEKERLYMEMRYIQELDISEISKMLDVKEDSIRKTLLRARTRLGTELTMEVQHEN